MKKYNVYIEVEVQTTETAELWRQDFEEAYADGKKVCTKPEDDLVGYMYDALKDKLEERLEGRIIDYTNDGDLMYLESQIEDFVNEKENLIDENGQCHLFKIED